MRGLRLKQCFLASLSLFGALVLQIQSAAAEGSPELDTGDSVTGGDAHDQEVHVNTRLYVDVLNTGGTEKICWRGEGNLTVYLPNDTSLATLTSTNTNGCTGALATTGSYRLALSSSQESGTRWEVRVCSSAISNTDCRSTSLSHHRDGRLWSTEWSFQSNTSFAADRSNNGSVFAVVPGGDVGRDAVIEMQMRGVSGAYYRLFANSTGPQTSGGVRVGRSVSKTDHAVVPLYRLYLNPPESAQYNWIPPVVSAVTITSSCGDGIVLDTASGSVTFNSNITGQYVLVCDVSRDGVYDFASPNDFSSFGNAAMGSNTVLWNGRTNGGLNATPNDYNCVVRLNVGEFHYMADDIETSHPGIRMFRVEANKTTKTAIRMYWDDTAIPNDAETMNGAAGVFSPTFPPPTGLDPGAYATASSPFYYVGGNTSMPTGNARAWGNFDTDGKGNDNYLDTFAAADTMQSPPFVVSVIAAAGDEDGDELENAEECAIGTDPQDEDTDGDGALDGDDDQPLIPAECSDSDLDGCDDCALGPQNPANDGPDTDGDGQCDNGDPDGDTVPNIDDVAPDDPLRCRDSDADGCDDCSAGSGPNVGNDGLDKDGDILCDKGDVDSDNDGVSDIVELGGVDLSLDADNDGIPDYRDSSRVVCIDLLPLNGICDVLAASVDADGDQIPNHLDRDSDRDGLTDAREAGGVDANGDGVPDSCLPVTATGACSSGIVASPPNTDSPADAIADYLDSDSDGDGLTDQVEAYDTNGDGIADVLPSNADTDQDGIDNAFDPSCIPASNCGGTLGRPVTSPLSAARDSNGDGIGDWLQVCGDAYVTLGQACDDGNSVNTDACSNSCLRGPTIACTLSAQCDSMLCDSTSFSCQACVNNQSSGTDAGCTAGAPACRTNAGVNSCFTCADTAAGTATDDGCSGAAPMCNTSGNGGLGACVACLADANCDDGNACTADTCQSNTCGFASRSAGTSCTGGVCDGAASTPMCVACVDNAPAGSTDSGCGGAARACDTSGAAPVCVACIADGDCASGVCGAGNVCVTCEDNQTGATTDHGCGGAAPLCNAAANSGAGACVACFDSQAGDATDVGCGGAAPVCNPTSNTCATCLDAAGDDDVGCSGATAMCNTSASGGLGACVACLNASHCGDGNSCTTDSCSAGACSNAPTTAGTSCTGGVCNGTAPAMCVACVDNAAVGQTDSGCGGAARACDTSGAAPVCVACIADGDCASGVCGAGNVCVTCEDNQTGAITDHGCGGVAPLCNAAANSGAGACVACFDSQAGDATDVGCGGATPVCNPASNTCATCLDAAGNDDVGCSGATAMCNTSAGGGLGACVGCLSDANCSADNSCTTDSCTAGTCSSLPVSAGSACTGGVCNGTAPAMCVACVDNAAVGQTDSGCGGAARACDASGAAPVCVACIADGDCGSGVCADNNTCVTCEDDQVGAAADHGCSGATALCNATANGGLGACVGCFDDQAGDATDVGCSGATPVCDAGTNTCATCLDAAGDDDIGCSGATALCDTSGNGGLGACAGCLNDGQCDDSNACTTDTCQAGSCDNDSLAAGAACVGGVCDGAASAPQCITCLDDATGLTVDSGCDGDSPLCDESSTSPACAECLALADCPLGMYCDTANTCVTGCAQDSDCVSFPEAPRCELTDQVCVECLTSSDCEGTEVCDASNACSQPDSDGDGVTDDVDLDDDNDGVTDDLELGGVDLSLDSDDDGVPDYRDADAVTCLDVSPIDGVCDETPAAIDSDGDGIPNHLDRDSDGDGITDAREAGGADDDGDGIPDDCLPVDADGLCQAGPLDEPASTDDDGTPDFLDLDSDGDGILDLDEAFDSDGDGVSNIEPEGEDTDGNGIDDAFDPACSDLSACGGVLGQPVLGALAPSQDWDGNDVPNWLQTCGDSYPTVGEACDDGNGVDDDACSNSCLRGIGVSCGDDGECGSALCDPEVETCQGCIDDEASGSDTGCAVGAPTCAVVSGQNACVVCADDQAGLATDDGCSTDAALCDETAAGGLGACIECFSATDCDDDNECTTESCSAGACGSTASDAGSACASGVCDGQAAAACVGCIDDEAAGMADSGCDDGAPFCSTEGGAPVCLECLEDSDCGDGRCTDAGVCEEGCASASDCAGQDGTPQCDTDSAECVECTSDAHCRGEMLCTAGNSCSFDDNDGDGLADDVDQDDDGDGITDSDELGGEDLSGDEDGDGIPDYKDPDFVSCTASDDAAVCDALPQALDVDGDGIANHLDDDSDGDGIPDATEGHDADFDGTPDRTAVNADSDRDGLDDAFDGDCSTASACDGVIGVVAPRPDADGDDKPNFLDADDDGDGRSTAEERADASGYEGSAEEPADIDGDGVRNWYDTDSDGDGALDVTENMNGGDANDDGLLDYLDPTFRATDTDGDGVLDVVECPAPAHPESNDCPDTDGDGKPDYDDTDDDNDGVLTAMELNPPQGRDVDGDGIPNYLDTDDDGDGVPTRDELADGGGVLDTDNDGTSNQLDTDDDGDGIPTARELTDDGATMDTDGDGRPNHLDTDDDDDTILTRDEIADDGSFLDTDGDGVSNHLDPDDDGDGIVTANEPGDEDDNGVPDYLEPYVKRTGGTLAGGALCAVSYAGSGGTGGMTSGALLGFGLLLALRIRSRKKKLHDLARTALSAAVLFALSMLFGSPASAQVAVDQFKPAPLASDGFALSRPDVLKPGAWGLQLMLDYANDPLVFELIPDDEDSEHRVISDHLVGHVGAAVGIWDRFTIFGMLPIHLVMSGEDDPLVDAPEPDGAGIGDLAFGGRFLLLGTGTSTGALALELIARVPTAKLASSDQAYSGDAIGSYEPALVGEIRAGAFDVRLRGGARLREPRTVGNLKLDHEVVFGLGARYRLIDALYAHAEVYGSTFVASAFAREQTPLEALLGAKYQPSDFHFGIAAGPGILRGYGSPDVRIVGSIGYAPVEKHEEPVDTDRDGLFDSVDACPLDPEDKDTFEDHDGCPDPDNDKDGIVDARDQCPNDPEDADGFEDEDGCPDPDNDKDGIADAQDQCRNEPEDTDDFEDADGCPDPDNDKDGLVDPQDSCPNDPEDFDGFEDQDGCPEEGSGKVKITCEKIDLQDKVFFDTGSDRIQERSFDLLDQVVQVLQAAKHIQRMRIEGHTDSRGNDKKNLELSKRRAASVVRYLVEHGVTESRLESEGYGEAMPIMDNKTANGRGENRRVEFVIVAQDSSCTK